MNSILDFMSDEKHIFIPVQDNFLLNFIKFIDENLDRNPEICNILISIQRLKMRKELTHGMLNEYIRLIKFNGWIK